MKKLLYQLDTDALPSVFDNVVAHDGGADHVMALGGISPANVRGVVEGAIFTRAPADKRCTALFVGGSRLSDGEALLEAIRQQFFGDFRVSVMLDSNGANTTAAAAVAWIRRGRDLSGQRAVVLGGTGPVGSRAAALLAGEGAHVTITSRTQANADDAVRRMREAFEVDVHAVEAATVETRIEAIGDAQIVVSAGASGAVMLPESAWRDHRTVELLVDANATPPAGIEGVRPGDRGTQRHGRTVFGALGFGSLKIAVHRACIARLFERNDQVFDAQEILAMAVTMLDRQLAASDSTANTGLTGKQASGNDSPNGKA